MSSYVNVIMSHDSHDMSDMSICVIFICLICPYVSHISNVMCHDIRMSCQSDGVVKFTKVKTDTTKCKYKYR